MDESFLFFMLAEQWLRNALSSVAYDDDKNAIAEAMVSELMKHFSLVFNKAKSNDDLLRVIARLTAPGAAEKPEDLLKTIHSVLKDGNFNVDGE